MEKIISCGLALIAITFLMLAFAVQGQESVIFAPEYCIDEHGNPVNVD